MTKQADQIKVGDVVIPTRGRHVGLQCEVKEIKPGKYATITFIVVPVLPVGSEFNVDHAEEVQVVR